MFERFTEDARQVVVLAQEEARILKHNYIGTEHLLLGIARVGGPAAEALASAGLDLGSTRADVARIVGSGTEAASGQVPFTPRAKRTLEDASREALERQQRTGPEHLLLAVLTQPDGVARRVVAERGVAPELTERVLATLADAGPSDDVHPVSEIPLTPSLAGYAVGEPIGEPPHGFLPEVYQSAELIALGCTGLIVTAALIAVAVLDGASGSHSAVEAGVLAGAAFGPASMLVALAAATAQARWSAAADGPEPLSAVAMTVAAVGLAAAGIAVHAVALTIALGAGASSLAIAAAAYASWWRVTTPSRWGR